MNSFEETPVYQLPKLRSSPSLPQIPAGKPHFRSAEHDRITRAQHLRVKLWKLHSCSFANYQQELGKFPGGNFSNQRKRNIAAFHATLKYPTLKKCLKHARKITFNPNLFSEHRYFLRICRIMRLDFLSTSIVPKLKPLNMLKAFMNSKLKRCFLFDLSKASSTQKFITRLIPVFSIFKHCQLVVERKENCINLLLNTDKLRSSFSLEPESTAETLYIRDHIIISPPVSLEKITFACHNNDYRSIEFIPDLPPMPNLKILDFSWQGLLSSDSDKRIPLDLSFVKNLHNLETLKIQILSDEIETLDFVAELPSLKEFDLSLSHELKGGFPANLTKLEKFGFRVWNGFTPFKIDGLRNFIRKNVNLKALDLSLLTPNIAQIFKDFTLYNLEKLRFHFLQSFQPLEIRSANQIAQMLKTHHFIKQLLIEFPPNTSDWSSVLLKEGLPELKSLESLVLKFHLSLISGGMPQSIHFIEFPAMLQNMNNLRTIDLNLGAKFIEPAELCSILDGLFQLKNLEKFGLTAVFAKLTREAFDKLLSFLISIRHDVKSLHLELRGVNQEESKMLRRNLLPKFPLSQDKFLFI